jgi:outer membrane protein assembly factor BamA
MGFFKEIFYCCFFCLITAAAAAQNIDVAVTESGKLLQLTKDSSAKFVVKQVNIFGNSKTKEYIIRREIHIQNGDTLLLSSIDDELQKIRQQVYNTNLFNEVKVELANINAGGFDINISLKERWYIFPLLKFQLVDRNINEWIQKYDADLGRVVYGIKFTHYNLTGRRDMLRLTFLNGFTRNVSFSYFKPLSNKDLTKGFSFAGGYVKNKEFIYKTSYDNKPMQFNNGDFSRKNTFVGVGFNFRKRFLHNHYFNITFNHIDVVDSLLLQPYNPHYFNSTSGSKNFIDLSYTYQYINANNAVYPLKGTTASLKIIKRGFGFTGGINMFSVEGTYNKYWPLKSNWYASVQLSGKTTLPFDQPYINQRALGYGDANLRGLELYVVDGVAYGLMRSTLKKKLFTINVPNIFKSKKYPVIPFTFFAKTYTDFGYAYNRKMYETNLSNKFLYTGGFGIDIYSLYDVTLRLEYSFNQLGKNGLFLQAQSGL